MLGTVVDTVISGLLDLVTKLFDSLKQLVDLFGTVGEAFSVLWTWLPPEITADLDAPVYDVTETPTGDVIIEEHTYTRTVDIIISELKARK